MKSFSIKNQVCFNCSHPLNAGISVSPGNVPKENDLFICAYCGSLGYIKNGQLAELPPFLLSILKATRPDLYKQIQHAQAVILNHVKQN